MTIAEGFPGQRLVVVPRPRVANALTQPGTRRLTVTDCGYYPRARAHGMVRSVPVDQAVVLVCTDGEGWFEAAGQRHAITPGHVVVAPPGVPHAYGAAAQHPWTLWWMHVTGGDVPELLAAGGISAERPVKRLRDEFHVVALLEEIVNTMERDPVGVSAAAAAGAAWHLLGILAAQAAPAPDHPAALDRAVDHLHAHVGERTSVEDLAAMANLSPSHFSALFRRHLGCPVLRYQTQLRMSHARLLLDTTDLAISAVASQVGYADPLYFARQFTATHGVSPRRYRSQRKG